MARVIVNLSNKAKVIKDAQKAMVEAVHDVSDDLVRTSSESAPHDKGILEQSFNKEVVVKGSKIIGIVDYAVVEDNGQGGFNYAYWIHEGDYNLGEGSIEKANGGGGVGMSGKSYPVGPKFLSGVLDGEAETYKEYMQKMMDKQFK